MTTAARQAHTKLWNAIWYGGFKRSHTCEKCGRQSSDPGQIHAHHDDYSKPLDVRWLCASCHKRHHLDLRRAAGTYHRPPGKKGAA